MGKYPGVKILILVLSIALSACSGNAGRSKGTVQKNSQTPQLQPTGTPFPTAAFTPAPTLTPTPTPIVILDPKPIEVRFSADDGTELLGYYYPGSENPSPVIVLVHWAEGDLTDWEQIATWLQNRGQLDRLPDYNHTWKSSDWFPENGRAEPLAVFIFTLRNCEGGCRAYQPAEWLLDIEAAMLQATRLQGIDTDKIMTGGASIGADGALYGCTWLNQTGTGSCIGSFSLSPSSSLTLPYDELANDLIGSDPPLPVYCLHGLRDDASVETCSGFPGLVSVDYGYIENHGMELIQSGQDPDPLILFMDFVEAALAAGGE